MLGSLGIDSVDVSYGYTRVLNGVSLDVAPGEFVAVQGPMLLGLPGLLLSSLTGMLFFLLFEIPAVGLVLLTRAGARRPPTPAYAGPVPGPDAPSALAPAAPSGPPPGPPPAPPVSSPGDD